MLEKGRAKAARDAFATDLGEVFPSYGYTRPIDEPLLSGSPEFIGRLLQHYNWINETFNRGAAAHLFRLEDVYVFNNTIHRIDGEQVFTVFETARANDRPYSAQKDWTAAELRSGAMTMDDEPPSLYLGSAGSHNYGHWLVDDLGRAEGIALIARHSGSKRIGVVMPGFGAGLDKVKQDSLLISPTAGVAQQSVCFVPNNQLLHFRTLYYVTPISYHPALKSPAASQMLRAHARDHGFGVPAAASRRRVYVVRGSSHGRAIVNQAAVSQIFEAAGFLVADVDGMSFGQQVALFKDADIVAGCMGAAMTNTVFCSAGATVLHLAPEGWMEPFYWDLAATCGHRYAAVFGQCLDTTIPAHQASFTVDTARVSAMLERLLG